MSPSYSNPLVQLHQGDALEVLAQLAECSIHAVVTSPPFWGLRQYANEQQRIWDATEGCEHKWGEPVVVSDNHYDFGSSTLTGSNANQMAQKSFTSESAFCSQCPAWCGALGQEPTVQLYIAHLLTVMDALWRVLRGDGCCWVNLDDTRLGSRSPGGDYRDGQGGDTYLRPYNRAGKGMRSKDMALVPERFILAVQERGWLVRSKVVWALPNPMPESARDRPTDSYQMLYLLTKQERYWWGQEAVKEPAIGSWNDSKFDGTHDLAIYDNVGRGKRNEAAYRNARNMQTWATAGLGSFRINGKTLTHFAAFPLDLATWCIRASCPQTICATCGAGWVQIIDRHPSTMNIRVKDAKRGVATPEEGYKASVLELDHYGREKAGWTSVVGTRPTCSCPQILLTRPGLVLDPFMGSGTTAIAAQQLGRRCIGIDLSADYISLAAHRLEGTQPALFQPVAGRQADPAGGCGYQLLG